MQTCNCCTRQCNSPPLVVQPLGKAPPATTTRDEHQFCEVRRGNLGWKKLNWRDFFSGKKNYWVTYLCDGFSSDMIEGEPRLRLSKPRNCMRTLLLHTPRMPLLGNLRAAYRPRSNQNLRNSHNLIIIGCKGANIPCMRWGDYRVTTWIF